MPDPQTDKRFKELLGLLLDDEIDATEISELANLVKENQDYSKELREQLEMSERISQYENPTRASSTFSYRVEAAVDAEESADDFISKVVQLSDETDRSNHPSRLPWAIAVASMAAAIALLLQFVFTLTPTEEIREDVLSKVEATTDQGIAVVSKLVGSLNQNSSIRDSGDTVSPGELVLESGYATLEFYSGAQVMVAGPAKLELVDSMRLICHEGKLRARVPKVAQGFTIETPESNLVDLGTEFGVRVDGAGQTELHVFDGEVEAYDANRSPASKRLITAGLALSFNQRGQHRSIPVETSGFNDLTRIENMYTKKAVNLFEKWKSISTSAQQDNRMIAYYDFQPESEEDRILPNKSAQKEELDGAIVGATWSEGPWPGKKALSFKRPGDQVRIDLPGNYDAVTLAAWVKVDGLDRSHNSLLLTDNWEVGEPHWQFRQNGMLSVGLRYSENERSGHLSESFVNLKRIGQWVHLCTVIDPKSEQVVHYLNGSVLSKATLQRSTPYSFGPSSIGNWGKPAGHSIHQIRNLNGKIAELMVYGAALEEEEVQRLALR
ncbi:LamG-like jellyroll fold domain-containing protein [Pelagicoccus mobilis]|uniref:FecR domain-containing protein n=1 Tax=Pelagicoccus mobilis TaxID=415221 RepID=A0A934RTF1_9BACT|nr:LamG-like jellyroll fold domain-containing protein [Pelagicoccus mobilis]MBK1876056.1 FecR domain-containing protein [Pelagicoccus mobilis]